MSRLQTRLLDGFEDSRFGRDAWNDLLRGSASDNIYLTWQWQRAWWEIHQRGELRLVAVERDGQVIALAPFYTECAMIFFLGTSFESGYLDFIGDISDPEVLDALLETARAGIPEFVGFRLYFVSDRSSTAERLQQAADRLGLSCHDEETIAGPTVNLTGQVAIPLVAATRKNLLRQERFFRRAGVLQVDQLQDGEAILHHLEQFFEQHIARWAVTSYPSTFLQPKSRLFLERLTRLAAQTGWLRFARMDWQGCPIAFHYGFCYHGRYYWELPSFAVEFARYSPGVIMLRRLLLAAVEEGARTFDLGIGEQAYKDRFATDFTCVRTWGLYPSQHSSSLHRNNEALHPAEVG